MLNSIMYIYHEVISYLSIKLMYYPPNKFMVVTCGSFITLDFLIDDIYDISDDSTFEIEAKYT